MTDDGDFKVFGPFFNPVHAHREAHGPPGARPCLNAHLIGRSVGETTPVKTPTVPDALSGPYYDRLHDWHRRREMDGGPS